MNVRLCIDMASTLAVLKAIAKGILETAQHYVIDSRANGSITSIFSVFRCIYWASGVQ